MPGFIFRVIGLVLGTFFGFSKLAPQRVRVPLNRSRGRRLGGTFLMIGAAIAGQSTGVMAEVSVIANPNITSVDPITQLNINATAATAGQSTQDMSAYPNANLNTVNLAGPIPAETLYGDSLLTDAPPIDATAAELTPRLGDLNNDLYVDLFVLGDLYLDSREFDTQLDSTSFALLADNFLTIPEPMGATMLACGVLGWLTHTRMGKNHFSSH